MQEFPKNSFLKVGLFPAVLFPELLHKGLRLVLLHKAGACVIYR